MLVQIERKPGYELSIEEIHDIVRIYHENNDHYEPTLQMRFHAATMDELYTKLYDSIIMRIEKGHIFYLIYDETQQIIGFNNHCLTHKTIQNTQLSVMDIGTTSIQQNMQNKGIGKALYTRMDMDARDIYRVEAVTRRTWSTNTRQIELYKRYEYEPYIVYINHYGIPHIDSICYYKQLYTQTPLF